MERVGFVLGGIWAQEAPVLFLDLLSSLGNAEEAPSRQVRTQKPGLWLSGSLPVTLGIVLSIQGERLSDHPFYKCL